MLVIGLDVGTTGTKAVVVNENGQVLSVDEKQHGWVTPVYAAMQLGWGKSSQGQMKNHYPKGLRML